MIDGVAVIEWVFRAYSWGEQSVTSEKLGER